ncbi:MAG TPA: HNH endonuclease [Candidatus Angelobacter sp.]|nr:HNH endonuclease [Candidatus Angelobacter sp.]
MKTQKINAVQVWKQFEDVMVPRLDLCLADRAVYSHLVRHSRLEGKLQFRFSIAWLAEGARLCKETVRPALRRLVDHGALRVLERSKAGHLVEVYLPEEIPDLWPDPREAGEPAPVPKTLVASLEEVDFLKTPELRQAVHARERGRCFYCLRQTNERVQCIDHVVPRAESGRNSYRNLVSCCVDCNGKKGARPADEFLCQLYREGCLGPLDLAGRLRALDAVTSGKRRPQLPKPFSERCTGGL